ncbi:MAG TPA: Xaa-Pro peptidase family protein [Xanthobacteraceae bacterium]|nr:Xaa-Pro peptidase family protein [Xanthobacteraceae bacterium]
MNFKERLANICARMRDEKLALLIAVHDGSHFIEKPNPVTVLTGFKSVGPAAVLFFSDGSCTLVVSPAWDADRAAEMCPRARVLGAHDFMATLLAIINFPRDTRAAIGIAGLGPLPSGMAAAISATLPGVRSADRLLFDMARAKTEEEIALARKAARVAELGFAHLLEIARPGMTEDALALALKDHMKALGAEDNFLLLTASPHNRAVQPSTGRRLAHGDIILAEITPSVGGQLTQICRTVAIGEPAKVLRNKYALVIEAMNAGIAAARPGVPMAEVCRSINQVLEAQGYGEYCHPPHIRRRGHGLGFASIRPGDVSLDNQTVLEPDMLFMIHPNQYLPETGYLLCGEPVLITAAGAEVLTREQSALGVISG